LDQIVSLLNNPVPEFWPFVGDQKELDNEFPSILSAARIFFHSPHQLRFKFLKSMEN